jgi:negative regulator of flagellin synthesis FlgM
MEINGKSPLVDLSARLHNLEGQDQQVEQTRKADKETVKPMSDRIELSVRSRELMHLDELIRSVPDVREAKVEQVRQAIESGTYNVRAEQVAEKILGGHLIDEIF